MVYMSQQLGISYQNASESKGSGQDETTRENGFLKALDKSMRTEPSSASRAASQKERSVRKAVGGTEVEKRYQRSTDTEGATQTAESKRSVQNKDTVSKALEDMPDTEFASEEENSSPLDEDLLEQAELLQSLFGDIIAILQKQSEQVSEIMPEDGLTGQELLLLRQGLELGLERLLKIAESLEGTKTSKLAARFAEKLQQLLESDFAALQDSNGEPVQVKVVVALKELIEKMLHETESAKAQIVRQTVREFVIPAMESEMAQPASVDEADNGQNPGETVVGQAVEGSADQKREDGFSGQQPSQSSGQQTEEKGFTGKLVAQGNAETEPAFFQNMSGNEFSVSGNYPVERDKPVVFETLAQRTTSKSVVVQQVIEKAEMLLSENKSEMVMQLKPDSLGKISLKVIHERGEIIAQFVAENEQVKAILESNLQLLRDSLQKTGVNVQSLSVSVGQNDQNSQNSQGEHARRNYRGNGAPKTGISFVTGIEELHRIYRFKNASGDFLTAENPEINLTA